MSLRLLLDEDTQAKRLIHQLQKAGHDVETVTEAGLIHKLDRLVLAYAVEKSRIIMTRNCGDFHALHQASPFPPGVLAIYQHNTAQTCLTATSWRLSPSWKRSRQKLTGISAGSLLF